MKKRIVTIALVIALLATCFAGTYAYLTDTKAATNTMTLGNVKIEQIELKRKDGVAYNAVAQDGDLVPFEDDMPLYPAVPTVGAVNPYTAAAIDDAFAFGPYTSSGTTKCGLWSDAKLSNQMDKFVFVKNTSDTTACYYRTIFAFELPEGMEYDDNMPDKELFLNLNSSSSLVWENCGYVTVGGTRYMILVATYTKVLEPGKTSIPTLLQVLLTHHTTNEDMALLGPSYDILVLSQAVQTAGFPDADTALNTAFGEVTPEEFIKWWNEING